MLLGVQNQDCKSPHFASVRMSGLEAKSRDLHPIRLCWAQPFPRSSHAWEADDPRNADSEYGLLRHSPLREVGQDGEVVVAPRTVPRLAEVEPDLAVEVHGEERDGRAVDPHELPTLHQLVPQGPPVKPLVAMEGIP